MGCRRAAYRWIRSWAGKPKSIVWRQSRVRRKHERPFRHREAAFAAVAIHTNLTALALDCFALLAMTPEQYA
jgi:hypothetical protein